MSLLCEMNGVSRPSALAARNVGEIIKDSGFLLVCLDLDRTRITADGLPWSGFVYDAPGISHCP
jgi:hypothetical protein